jgi:hypothetical protein
MVPPHEKGGSRQGMIGVRDQYGDEAKGGLTIFEYILRYI